jgi:hypothetical protein
MPCCWARWPARASCRSPTAPSRRRSGMAVSQSTPISRPSPSGAAMRAANWNRRCGSTASGRAAAQGVEDLIASARATYPRREPRYHRGGHPAPHRLSGPALCRASMSTGSIGDPGAGLGRVAARGGARHLAVRMSLEDVIRVAQAKTSRRSNGRACAARCAPRRTSRWRSPSISSPASRRLPRSCRRRWPDALIAWGERTGRLGKIPTSPCMCAATTIWGFARLRLVAEPALVAAAHLPLCRGAGRDRALARPDPR